MYFKVREGINEGEVEARYINTLLNISDPLTKAVSREVVSELAPVIAGIGDEPNMPDPEDQLQKVDDYMGKPEDHVVPVYEDLQLDNDWYTEQGVLERLQGSAIAEYFFYE